MRLLNALFTVIGIITVTASIQPSAIASKTCTIQNSIYEAVGNPEFKLTFSPPPRGKVINAVATLQHSKRGKIWVFEMTQSNGYGSSTLLGSNREELSFNIVFFDRNLQPTPGFGNSKAPEYVFVSGLGSADHYSINKGSREFKLGDVMWKFSRCGQ